MGEKFHLVKNENQIIVTYENWMTFTVKDFSNNHYLVPEFFIRSRAFHQLNKELIKIREVKPKNEYEENEYIKEFMDTLVAAIHLFVNITENCLEDPKTFDADLMGRFASLKSDLNFKELNENDMSDFITKLLSMYDFALSIMNIIEYCFLLGGKIWAERAIEQAEIHKQSEHNIQDLLEDPNIGVKAVMIDQNGNTMEVSRERLLQLFGKKDVEDDPFNLANMETIGEA